MKKRYIFFSIIVSILFFHINVYAALNCQYDIDNNKLEGYELVGGVCVKVLHSSVCSNYSTKYIDFADSVYFSQSSGYKGLNNNYCLDVKRPANSDTINLKNWSCDGYSDMLPYSGYCTFVTGEADEKGNCPNSESAGYAGRKSINGLCISYQKAHCDLEDKDKCYKEEQQRDDPTIINKDCPANFEKVGDICIKVNKQDDMNCACDKSDIVSGFINGRCVRFQYTNGSTTTNDTDYYCPSNYDFMFDKKCYKEETTLSDGKCREGIEVGSGNNKTCLIITSAVKGSSGIKETYKKNNNICEPNLSTTPDNNYYKSELDISCSTNPNINKIAVFVGYIIYAIRILGPLLIIVLGMIDFFKAMTSNDKEAVNKATKALIRRIIAGIAIFIIPIIIRVINDFIDLSNGIENDSRFSACTKCILEPGSCNNTK